MASLINALVWDLNGTLITSTGVFPNFERKTPANAEYFVNGAIRLVPSPSYQPRFSSLGSLYLEKAATNYCTYPTQINDASWVKGSSITVLPDRVVGLSGIYDGDRVSVSSTLGNSDAQTLYKDIALASGRPMTATVYMRLAGGRFGTNDCIKITGDAIAPQTVYLAAIFNDVPGNYLPVVLNFTTAGTAPDPSQHILTDDPGRVVRLSFYCESAVSIDWGGIQIEDGTVRTSFIYQREQVNSRDGDSLIYPASPVAGLSSFLCYLNLELWRGDGLLIQAGDFKLEILSGALKATCGTVTVTDSAPLPNAAQIACRVSLGLQKMQIYVNGVLRARQTLNGYVAGSGTITVAGDGVRQIKCAYFFNRDVGDGSVDVGQPVLSELLGLFNQDTLFADLAESYSQIVFPSIRIVPSWTATIKLPNVRSASQVIQSIATGTAPTAQVVQVQVVTIVNASAVQRDELTIDKTKYQFVSDNTPTKAEIAAGLSSLVNSDADRTANASYTSGNDNFTLTATYTGDGFYASGTANLAVTLTTANDVGTKIVTVPNAADYREGAAMVYRDNVWIADVRIDSINTSNNQITIGADQNSAFVLIGAGDYLVQPSWQMRIGRSSYFCHHLEDYPDIKVVDKSEESFGLKNVGQVVRSITPYVKVTL